MTHGQHPARATPTRRRRTIRSTTVNPCQPDGGFTASGLITMLGVMFVAGAAVGFAAHFISQLFYLIIVFPVAIGLALGRSGVRLVKFANLRNPLLGGLAGLVGGAAAMMMMHYFDYHEFRTRSRRHAGEPATSCAVVSMPPAHERETEYPQFEDPRGVRRGLVARPYGSFPGFIDFSARAGRRDQEGRQQGLESRLRGHVHLLARRTADRRGHHVRDGAQADDGAVLQGLLALWKPFRRLGAFGGTPDAALAGVTSGDVNAIAAAQAGRDQQPAGVVTWPSAPTASAPKRP